ncbi:MAG: DUF4127 family protein [Candidatus Eremiobacteraeota bacterium]|nr:DUF4127 family protein [Candidatus Eremiobacteraeota bacterium]
MPLRILLLLTLLFSIARADTLLVPIDDRPANLLFVRQLARIGGDELVVAPRYLLGRFLSPGQSDTLVSWLEEQARPGDTAFVSADMLAYGGLVASRNRQTSAEEALARLSVLERLEGVDLQVLATLPRLSLRTSDSQAPYERKLAEWATKPGLEPPAEVPAEVVEEYLAVRRRNLGVLLRLVEMARQGKIAHLVIGQDDSHKTGLHQKEQEELLAAIDGDPRITLISGVDELSMDMLAGHLAGAPVGVRVIYSDPEAAEKVPPIESLPLGQMVEQHLLLSGARPVDDESAEVDLFVYVPSAKPWNVPGQEGKPPAESFLEQVKQAQQAGRRVAVADLSLVNRMDPFLAEGVLKELDLPKFAGFASWNTPANAVGTVIAQLVAHRRAETSDWNGYRRLESEKTHQAFLIARLIDDYGYQTLVRDQVKGQVAGLPADADPLLNLYGPVGLDIRLRLIEFANRLYGEHFRGREIEVEPLPGHYRFGKMELEVVLPWPRIFEVEARLDVRLEPVQRKSTSISSGMR